MNVATSDFGLMGNPFSARGLPIPPIICNNTTTRNINNVGRSNERGVHNNKIRAGRRIMPFFRVTKIVISYAKGGKERFLIGRFFLTKNIGYIYTRGRDDAQRRLGGRDSNQRCMLRK